MYAYTVSDNEDAIFKNEDSTALAAYLASLDVESRAQTLVYEWFIGFEGEYPEDKWEKMESEWASVWLDEYIRAGNPLYTIGTRVYLPQCDKVRKSQSRFCEITQIFPEVGRQYALLIGILSKGVSKSDKQVVYWPLNRLDQLEIVKNAST